jgi:hypothetical protein
MQRESLTVHQGAEGRFLPPNSSLATTRSHPGSTRSL